MSVLNFLKPTLIGEVADEYFVVVHPLDDAPETKLDASSLGRMPMTASVKASLMALRGYLLLMMVLVLYHVLDMAGVLGHGAH